ncbi:MAG: hypothetical protein JNM20_14780 [Rhizobiales bacterium]|nr:hypothetical protein [Hyphomicrobiales bacterium]
MTNSSPSMMPGAGSSGNSDSPTQEPPIGLAAAKSGCGCQDAHGSASASLSPSAEALESASMAAPSLLPGAVGAGAAAAAWRNNVRITALWSINQDRNCWAHFDNSIGWRKLSTKSESGLVSLNMLSANAYQMNAITSAYEENDGTISQMYVW